MSRLRRWLRREPGDVDLILPFDEVVTALGRLQERDVGRQVVPLDAIVGTVDRPKGFDRHFRPTTPQVRARWERIAAAMRRGEAMPPIDVYRVGDVYFVARRPPPRVGGPRAGPRRHRRARRSRS